MTDEETVAASYEVFVVDGKPGYNERQIIDWLKAQSRERLEKRACMERTNDENT